MEPSDDLVVVLAWYSEEEWTKLKGQAADREELDTSYEEWKQQGRELIESLAFKKQQYIKYFVSVDDLEVWCLKHNRPNDAAARAEYVTESARKKSMELELPADD